MARLGSEKRPALVRVRTVDRADRLLDLCNDHGWTVVIGVEPDQPEDVSDIEALVAGPTIRTVVKVGRNEPCPCGSGRKHKRCCAGAAEVHTP